MACEKPSMIYRPNDPKDSTTKTEEEEVKHTGDLVSQYLSIHDKAYQSRPRRPLSSPPNRIIIRCEIKDHKSSRDDETLEVSQAKVIREKWKFLFCTSAVTLIIFNLIVYIYNTMNEINLDFPLGFIPLPFFIWTWYKLEKANKKYYHLCQEEDDREVEAILNRPPPPPPIRRRGAMARPPTDEI